MPVIQPYVASDAPSSLVGGRSASPNDMGADVGAAMQTDGNDIASAAYKVQEDQGRLWAYNAVSALRLNAQKELQQQKESADPSNPSFATFANDYVDHFQNQVDTVLASAPSRSATKYLTMHTATLKDSLYQHAAGFQATAQAEYGTSMHDAATDHNTNSLTINPGNDNFIAIRASSESEIDGLHGLNYVQKQRMKDADLRKFAYAQVTGAALTNSTGFLRDIGLTGNQVTPAGPKGGVGTGVPGPAPVSSDPYFERALDSQGLTGPTRDFARAIYQQESGSGKANTSGVNSSGVTGPMQVQQATFDGLKAQGLIPKNADISNPTDNMMAGAALIRQLRDAYGGDPQKMAAAYYAGPKAVNADGSINRDLRDLKNPTFPTVGQYVDQVGGRIGATTTTPNGAPPAAMAEADPAPEGQIISAQSSLEGWDHLTVAQRIQTVRMAEQNVRLSNAGQGAAAAAAARALKAGQESDMNAMFQKITDPQNPQDVTADLRSNSRLTFEQRERMVAFQKSFNAGNDKTDPSTFNDLFQKIHAGAITNADQLTPFLGNGIKYEDLVKLRGEIDGKKQPMAAQRASFFSTAHTQISKNTISNNDPDGEANFYQFQNDANAYIDAKTKAGTPLADLLDPRNKDYVGNMIPRYQRSMSQVITDGNKRMTANAVVLPESQRRRPGESAAAYWARVGNAGGGK